MTDITSYVAASNDDAYEDGTGTFDTTAVAIPIDSTGISSSANYICGGLRVQLNVPRLATCNSFYLNLYFFDPNISCTIYAHASDNSPDFATNANIIDTGQRPRTTASATWAKDGLPVGYSQTVDLSSIVQEIVNRSGWVSGNYITFLLIATDGAGKLATFYSYDNGSNIPYLSGSYTYDPGYSAKPPAGNRLDFGPVNINTTLDKAITVSEIGTSKLEVSNPVLSGADAAKFSIQSPSFPFTIADGGVDQDITIRTSPDATGHLTATLTMTTNDPAQTSITYTLLADAVDIADWAVQIDSDRDDTFDNAIDDITDTIISASWNNGMDEPYKNVAPPARLTLKLDNTSGAYSQDDAAATYYGKLARGTLARVLAVDPTDSQLYQLCKLKISRVQLMPGSHTDRSLTQVCEDPMLDLLDADYRPPLQTNATVDEALTTMLERVRVAYPYPSSYWMLGVAGASELGQTTYLLNYWTYINFETGNTLFPFIGDNVDQGAGVSPQMLIGDLASAEDGRIWWDTREARMKFHNRHHDYFTATSSGTFTQAEILVADYRFQEDLRNEVTIQFEPREIGAANSTIWSQPGLPLAVKNGETKTIQAQYSDPANEYARIGAQDVQPAQAGFDYIANTLADGTGQDVTGRLYVHYQPAGGAAEITIRNANGGDMWLTTLQLRGTPIVSSGIQSVMARDAESAYSYDFRRETMTIRMIPTESEANSYAYHRLTRFSAPTPHMAAITVNGRQNATLITHALTRTVGDRIRVTDSQTSHDAYYIIVGESHALIGASLDDAGLRNPRHSVTWVLRPEDTLKGWRLETVGRGELGQQTYLVY